MASAPDDLQRYEEMFSHRFTSEDEEFQKYVHRPADLPPVVEDWSNRSRDGRQYRGRAERYDRQGGYRSGQWQERSWGNSYQQHRQQPYPQHGYSSYSSGAQYGRY